MPDFPQRIVCLTEETTETLYLLGEGHRVVGVSGYTVRPIEARRKPRVSAFTTAKFDAILALEPDLGTAVLVVAIGLVVLFLAGLSWRWIAAGVLGLLASAPVAWRFMHHYQRERILVFLHPSRDPLGAGYHIIQSQIAIGSGGLLGGGWMHGSQAYLNFLPEQTTDFIFAVLAEEFGLLGTLVMILLYLAIVFRILWLAQRASDRFSRLLGASIAALIFLYAFVNMAMVSGLLPVVGEPLPFVSFGGSSIVTLLAGCGAVMGLDARRSHLDHHL